MKNITLKPTPSGLPALGHQGQPLLAPRVMGGGDGGGRSSGTCWSALPNAMQKSWVPALVWTTAAKNQAGIFSQATCINLRHFKAPGTPGRKKILFAF